MVRIKIIDGIYGYRPEGRMVVVPTGPKDPPIGVDEAEAERLVGLGVAQYVDEVPHTHAEAAATDREPAEVALPDESRGGGEGGAEGDFGLLEAFGHADGSRLEDWKMDDLRKLAAELDVDTGKLRKKEALIEALNEALDDYFSRPLDEAEEAGDVIQ